MRHAPMFTLCLFGCAHAPAPAVSAPTAAQEPGAPLTAPVVAEDDGTFAGLVTRLNSTADEQQGDERCVFRDDAGAVHFTGRFAPSVHPLPQFDGALAALLEGAGSVEVLTRYGRYLPHTSAPTFAAFSESAPFARAALVVLGAQGVLVRPVGTTTLPASASTSADEAARSLRGAGLDGLFVTAERALPTADLVRALRVLGNGTELPLALVVALPPSTALRADTAPPASPAMRCADGLPEARGALGELDVSALRSGVAPLAEQLMSCLSAGSVAAQRGGRVRVALRIDARGRVSESCIVSSELSDDDVLGCVLTRARALQFARPTPSGSVDAEIPLALQPVYAGTPRALCERGE